MTEEATRRSALDRAYRENADHVYRVAYAIVNSIWMDGGASGRP
jgi:hypothetical protein